MSGKRRLRHSKKAKMEQRTSTGCGQSAARPDRKVPANPSISVKPPETTKHSSRQRKIAAFLTAPAVISGFAGAVPQVVINVVQEAIHAITARSSDTPQAGRAFSRVFSSSQQPAVSGGEYYFSEEWQSSTSSPATNQTAAERMANQVVIIALLKAGWLTCDATSKHRYIQWVLAGNMTPAEAAQVLAQGGTVGHGPLNVSQADIQPLEDLIRLIKEDFSLAGIPQDIRRDLHLHRQPRDENRGR